MPVDPWGHAYHYDIPGKHGAFDIYTYGENNQPDGVGINATRGNWSEAPVSDNTQKPVNVSGTYPQASS
jgi:hypothetical protein